MIKISEIFHSIQGEGRLAGVPSIFIRMSFCNLRCSWCDTPYTSWEPENTELGVKDVLGRVEQLAAQAGHTTSHIVITGGEPFLQGIELEELCSTLSRSGYHTTIETNATLFRPVQANLISMSPKLANSIPFQHARALALQHDVSRISIKTIRQFLSEYDSAPTRDCQIKYVIESEADLKEVEVIAAQAEIPREKILLMPQAVESDDLVEKSRRLIEICKRTGYAFSPRLHIELFGNRRGY
jgi:7-carboxy-7-deazaguanine synthase